ncbi:hypothetical protein [Polaribacter sp. Asnod1-A03]|uniref:hypothetical protein n=1 Tax=Polaribacter sp. Asnod1-A03 TaxID=3160581 RepID=UPI00386DD11A
MKLINPKNELIGKIELKFLPRKDEKIIFKEKNYTVNEIIHSEESINISVTEVKNEWFFF